VKPVVMLCASLFAAAQCVAQSTTYDPNSANGLVDIPCLDVWDSRQVVGVYTTYRALLHKVPASSEFSLEQLQPVEYGDYCSGAFDVATDRYTDIVNVRDDSYYVTLRRSADKRFTLESVSPRGAATTSMWVARNGANTVYLAGTIHTLRQRDFPLPRAFDEAYAKASTLYFEIDMDNPLETGEALSQAAVLQQMRDPQGRKLTQVLTPGNYAALASHMRGRGMAIEVAALWSAQRLVDYLRYWELSTYHGYSTGVDSYIANRAKQDYKAIHGLETSALQVSVLHTLGEGRENEIVENLLDEVATGDIYKSVEESIAIWRDGDTSTIYRESIIPMRADYYDDYVLLNVKRNWAWLPKIEALLQTPETEMVVVGVAHMAGDEGLVALLRARGYSVEKY
jgi:uncharacterized protein